MGAPAPGDGEEVPSPPVHPDPEPDPRPRPLLERLGLGLAALVMATLFGVVAGAAFLEGELFLAVMGAIGTLMVAWVGALTVLRG